jgi:hypothetical protein
MARRKRTHKTKHRRRHRIGAMALSASSPIVMYGSIALGYVLGNTVNGLLNNLVPAAIATDPTKAVSTGKILAAGQTGLGAALVFMKGRKTTVKTIAGGILLGSGLKRAMTVFKSGATTMGGYGDVPVLGAYRTNGQLGYRKVAGYGDVPVIGSYATPGALNGKVMGSMHPSGSGSGLMN